jgi:hypothetical protein
VLTNDEFREGSGQWPVVRSRCRLIEEGSKFYRPLTTDH